MEGDAIFLLGTNKRKKAACAVRTKGRAKKIKGAITEAARPWLKDNRTTMTGYAYSSLFDVGTVSHLDRCKFEDLFRWDESTGKFSAIGQRFNSSVKHMTAFELFILNSTDKCILPQTGAQELRESVAKGLVESDGCWRTENVIERSAKLDKMASSSSVNPQRAVIDSLSKSMNKGATFFVGNVQFVREYIKKLRGMRSTHSIDMDRLYEMERAFSIFNNKENISAKEAKQVLHCHLDHLVQWGIDPSYVLTRYLFFNVFNNRSSVSHRYPAFPMRMYDEISMAARHMDLDRPPKE
ncbi:hypothetical protein Pcinc_000605 [Petrolisthes cinctipes]|uniref:Uncharacterized protein n=1 Tax=Petrolisthes cinctipes TaxID=88211 RepID=A0AAE1GP86_PETCI|nr:hypothetical protein Pcinc_000605 [Petrolisthes cinctipes]